MIAQSASINAKYTLVSIAFVVGSLAIPPLSLFGQSGAGCPTWEPCFLVDKP